MIIGDFHTHTNYCDGANTAEEMLKTAISMGLKVYGFSSHSHLKYDESWNMSHASQEDYVKEVLLLKEKYKDKIEVLLGTEYDLLSDNDLSKFDYVIGSCHSIIKDGVYLSVDHSEQTFVECVNGSYDGDYFGFVRDYYELMSTAAKRPEFTFYGHFDLISKFNVGYKHFDEDDKRYKEPMYRAVEILAKSGKPLELNTKLTFGNTQTPIPSAKKWLSALCELGGSIIINSDAHSTARIGDKFDLAKALAVSAGFKSSLILTSSGFEEIKF